MVLEEARERLPQPVERSRGVPAPPYCAVAPFAEYLLAPLIRQS